MTLRDGVDAMKSALRLLPASAGLSDIYYELIRGLLWLGDESEAFMVAKEAGDICPRCRFLLATGDEVSRVLAPASDNYTGFRLSPTTQMEISVPASFGGLFELSRRRQPAVIRAAATCEASKEWDCAADSLWAAVVDKVSVGLRLPRYWSVCTQYFLVASRGQGLFVRGAGACLAVGFFGLARGRCSSPPSPLPPRPASPVPWLLGFRLLHLAGGTVVSMEAKPTSNASQFGMLGRYNYKLHMPLSDAVRAMTSPTTNLATYINIGSSGGALKL